MSNVEIVETPTFKPYVTDEMKTFMSYIINNEMKYKIGPCELGFFETEKNYCKLINSLSIDIYGLTGYNIGNNNRSFHDPRKFTLNFNIIVYNNNLEKVNHLLELMTASVGGRNNKYKQYTITEIIGNSIVKCGLVKTELFDKVYKYFHEYSKISVEDFVEYNTVNNHIYNRFNKHCNPNLAVEELYNDENKKSYIMVYDKYVSQNIGYSRIYFSILNKDLTDGNAKIISNILEI